MVECDLLPPTRFTVAGFTFGAELTFVCIILFVARRTTDGQLVPKEVSRVTTVTKNLAMFASQREFCRRVVIEGRRLPCLRQMAALAFRPIAATVSILDAMAIDTNFCDSLPLLRGMACRAGDFLMSSYKRESGLSVIESLGRKPAHDVVTCLAPITQAALMRLVLLVAADALR
jgi:hypothetical protein